MTVNLFFGIVKGERLDQIRNGKLHKLEYYVFIYDSGSFLVDLDLIFILECAQYIIIDHHVYCFVM